MVQALDKERLQFLRTSIEKIISELNFFLFDFEFDQKGRELTIQIKIDKQEALLHYFNWQGHSQKDVRKYLQNGPAVNLEDCELVSKKINEFCEAEIPDLEYNLEISSAGMFRKIKSLIDWIIFKNFFVKLRLGTGTPKGGDNGFLVNFLIDGGFSGRGCPDLTLEESRGKLAKTDNCIQYLEEELKEKLGSSVPLMHLKLGDKAEDKLIVVFLRYPVKNKWKDSDNLLLVFVKNFVRENQKGWPGKTRDSLIQAKKELNDKWKRELNLGPSLKQTKTFSRMASGVYLDLVPIGDIQGIHLEFII